MPPRRASTAWALLVPGLLLGVAGIPLALVIVSALSAALNAEAWRNLLQARQTWPALGLSLWTGLLATALSALITGWLLSRLFPGPAWTRVVRLLAPLLALPHAAFAIGLAAVIAPSGWLLRLVSPWATGFSDPPAWITTQDPWGLGLVAVLVAKELPFLLWAAATHLQRTDVAERLGRELAAARSMGYTRTAAWWRIVWPQLMPRMRWPLWAVLAYGLTVVDVALVIGPGSPPTLAMLAWGWLLDADAGANAQGAAAAWLLAGVLGVAIGLGPLIDRAQALLRRWQTNGRRGRGASHPRARMPIAWWVLIGSYAAVLIALSLGSVSGVWSFPALLPQRWTLDAWHSVLGSAGTVGTTLALAVASTATALAWSVAWLESAPARWDASWRRVMYAPLVLPAVLWVVGLHGMALRFGLDTRWSGLWLAHSLAVLPYVLVTLSPAYLGFDARLRSVSASLGHGRAVFLWRIKWPMLRATLAASFGVGFAVSVAQYLPTLFVGAGRYATVTTEAVTLASGAQRSLSSAYAWLQWVLPVLCFALAAWIGKPRRFE